MICTTICRFCMKSSKRLGTRLITSERIAHIIFQQEFREDMWIGYKLQDVNKWKRNEFGIE